MQRDESDDLMTDVDFAGDESGFTADAQYRERFPSELQASGKEIAA